MDGSECLWQYNAALRPPPPRNYQQAAHEVSESPSTGCKWPRLLSVVSRESRVKTPLHHAAGYSCASCLNEGQFLGDTYINHPLQ